MPDAYRPMSGQDIRDMTKCDLIGQHGFYGRLDLQEVISLLKYEQMREKRSAQESAEDKLEPPKCRMCGQPLPIQPEDKSGRPREYCSGCESFRGNLPALLRTTVPSMLVGQHIGGSVPEAVEEVAQIL